MAKLYLAALLAVSAASAAAQPAVQPNVDSAESRQALRQMSECLAALRPRWARALLAHPYLSNEQAYDASEALEGRDSCLRGDTELTFRTSTMVGSLAEHFVRNEIGGVDFARLSRVLSTMDPRNASEDFALCMAAANPAAARNLALSEFGSAAETAAATQLGRYVERCTNPGENLTVDLQSLRALTSSALYRGIVAVGSAGN
ncbi:MAG: hypothetical protein QOD42_1747 [Sphingomonadales bacterium]|jgi:hypothetical protein|nr:hypothetical protein [Sphingomonadales bacterium]